VGTKRRATEQMNSQFGQDGIKCDKVNAVYRLSRAQATR
jgi:hypothetical protein